MRLHEVVEGEPQDRRRHEGDRETQGEVREKMVELVGADWEERLASGEPQESRS